MDESDLEAEHAASRRLVDQLGTHFREVRESRADVVDLIRDVVHPGAALGEEAADRSVLAQRAQQLQPALADADEGRFDPLLLHPRAVLEPRAEQALVGVERVVEVIDRETDVMHGGGRLHVAIVFERLEATMRALALALVVTVALLAGCGSSGGKSTTAKPNGEASKPPARVLADARAAAAKASSAHVAGDIKEGQTPITLDLSTVRGKGAKGSMSTNGLAFDMVRIGDTVYVHGSDAFYKHFAGAAVAQFLHDKWLKGSATHGRLQSLAPLTSLDGLFAVISSQHGKLVNDGPTTYKGTQVVAIRDKSDGSRLYVAATGRPYPVALVSPKHGRSGAITFGDWNKPVSLSAPSSAIGIDQFGG